ncbi:hypothetical protein P2318_02550 [Myxococcaceae bacterium GXIMD 01537]
MQFFDAKFYEARALWFYARSHGVPVEANVRLRHVDVPWSRRPEVDGRVREGRWERAIEVKSYPLGAEEARALGERYRGLGFSRLTLIAPAFTCGTEDVPDGVELLPYQPDVAALRTHYRSGALGRAPVVEAWMAPGGLHFRYSVGEVGRGGARLKRTLNQVDRNIRTLEALSHELRQRVVPRFTPVRVHWSPHRLLFPKDLYFRGRPSYVLAEPLVFDIDGQIIHRAMFPCTLEPATGVCRDCLALARQHALRLVDLLRGAGLAPSVFFSGHNGFHVYVFQHALGPEARAALYRDVAARHIGVDWQVARARTPLIAFPGSVHGVSARPLVEPRALEDFHLDEAPPVGGP